MEANLAPANTDLDLDLQERINDAINALDVLRGTRARVEVMVSHGTATLTGALQSPMAAAEVARAATEVPGVSAIVNQLVDDGSLSAQVAEALASDARTAAILPGYEVVSNYGHLKLVGYFSPDQAQAVEAVARAVSGARSVTVAAL